VTCDVPARECAALHIMPKLGGAREIHPGQWAADLSRLRDSRQVLPAGTGRPRRTEHPVLPPVPPVQPAVATFDWGKARDHLDPQPQRPARDPDRDTDVTALTGWVARQPEGNRNAGLFYAANRVLEAGHDDQLDALAEAARFAGLDEREITRTIESARRTATRQADARPFRQADREAG